MEWCPTMDLIAIATSDSQVSVYRVTWQRLFAISTSHSVHCIAWRPDGQQLAVGMSDGSVAFYNVEVRRLLAGIATAPVRSGRDIVCPASRRRTASCCPPRRCTAARSGCWHGCPPPPPTPPAAAATRPTRAPSRTCSRRCLCFLRAPVRNSSSSMLGRCSWTCRCTGCCSRASAPSTSTSPSRCVEGVADKHVFDRRCGFVPIALSSHRLPVFTHPFPLPFPPLPPFRWQADESARVHLAVHGRFSLGFLSLAHFPALDFGGEAPALLSASLAPSLHALTLVVQTKVGDGEGRLGGKEEGEGAWDGGVVRDCVWAGVACFRGAPRAKFVLGLYVRVAGQCGRRGREGTFRAARPGPLLAIPLGGPRHAPSFVSPSHHLQAPPPIPPIPKPTA